MYKYQYAKFDQNICVVQELWAFSLKDHDRPKLCLANPHHQFACHWCKIKNMQNLIQIYHVVQEFWAFSLTDYNQLKLLNTISNGNSSHFMQTISSYLVKISVNVVNYCTIITWYKIVIDNCFCDGQSSKGNNSKSINDRVTILALCTSTHVAGLIFG